MSIELDGLNKDRQTERKDYLVTPTITVNERLLADVWGVAPAATLCVLSPWACKLWPALRFTGDFMDISEAVWSTFDFCSQWDLACNCPVLRVLDWGVVVLGQGWKDYISILPFPYSLISQSAAAELPHASHFTMQLMSHGFLRINHVPLTSP